MYMPLYAGGDVPESLAQRRARLVGFVYSPLRMGDLMLGVLGPSLDELDIRIYDGADEVHKISVAKRIIRRYVEEMG